MLQSSLPNLHYCTDNLLLEILYEVTGKENIKLAWTKHYYESIHETGTHLKHWMWDIALITEVK